MRLRVIFWSMLTVVAVACGSPPRTATTTTADSVAPPDSAATTAGAAAPGAAATDSSAAPGAASSAADTAGADSVAQAGSTARAASLASAPGGFPHARHRALPCTRCHTSVPGHATHANVACTSCHARVPAAGPVPTSAQCGACHHAATRGRPCATCHDPTKRGALPLKVTWKLSVWSAPRERDLSFDHRWHTSLQCGACHRKRPSLLPDRACGSCHVHHEGRADCRSCHKSPPAGVHTVAAHNGCAGSGCHQSPPVRVATLSRAECLLCHPDRVNHQPGQACARCHMLETTRGPPAGEESKPR